LLAESEARGEAEDEVVTLRSELQRLRAQAEEQARALEARAGDLERRLAEALAELEAVTKAERRAVREAYQLKEKVAQQAALIDERQSRPD
jgi:VIT1/CCC1 family predicted Fe2+/Mn2+ transporter